MAVYLEHGPAILKYLRVRAESASDAEELHAETFCRAWQAWPRFRGDPPEVRPWLFRIARNLLVDRHRRKRLVWLLPLERYDRASANDEPGATVGDRALAEQALRRLSGSDRELIAFRLAGLSHREIGRIQGRSERAVKTGWHRALERLRRHMGISANE